MLNYLIVDIGAAHTLISADAVFELGISAMDAQIITMYGIGGEEHSFRKSLTELSLGNLK